MGHELFHPQLYIHGSSNDTTQVLFTSQEPILGCPNLKTVDLKPYSVSTFPQSYSFIFLRFGLVWCFLLKPLELLGRRVSQSLHKPFSIYDVTIVSIFLNHWSLGSSPRTYMEEGIFWSFVTTITVPCTMDFSLKLGFPLMMLCNPLLQTHIWTQFP